MGVTRKEFEKNNALCKLLNVHVFLHLCSFLFIMSIFSRTEMNSNCFCVFFCRFYLSQLFCNKKTESFLITLIKKDTPDDCINELLWLFVNMLEGGQECLEWAGWERGQTHLNTMVNWKRLIHSHCLCTYACNLGCCARILFICEGMGFRRPGSSAGCHTNTFSRLGACGHTLYSTALN